jgi:hypothetical protein
VVEVVEALGHPIPQGLLLLAERVEEVQAEAFPILIMYSEE